MKQTSPSVELSNNLYADILDLLPDITGAVFPKRQNILA